MPHLHPDHSASRRRAGERSLVLGVALALMLGAVAFVIPARQASAATEFTCNTDVQVIGVAGSGENETQDPEEVGATVRAAIDRIRSNLVARGRTVAVQAVLYPARSVDLLIPSSPGAWDPVLYLGGLQDGIATLNQMLVDFESSSNTACAHQRLVLVGYSQGAIVVHEALHRLQAQGRSNLINRIDAAVLVADGHKLPKDNTVKRYGTDSVNRYGIFYGLNPALALFAPKFDRLWGMRVKHLCFKDDIVCDINSGASGATNSYLKGGMQIHGTYIQARRNRARTTYLEEVVDSINYRFAPDTPRLVSPGSEEILTGEVGVQFVAGVTAWAPWGCTASVALAQSSRFPVGLQLNGNGTIFGTPTVAGRVSSKVILTSECGARGNTTDTATITFTINKAPPEQNPTCGDMPATIVGFGRITGTEGDDVIVGSPGKDTIMGLGGNDIICGRGGDDTIDGGAGDDGIVGEDGNDKLAGGAGGDFLHGGNGVDTLSGGDGEDFLIGDGGRDILNGGNDDDFLDGGADSDKLDGGAGDDGLLGDGGNDKITGGAGYDYVEGGEGDDVIDGGNDDDFLDGGDGGNDKVAGGRGIDTCVNGSSYRSCEDTDEASIASSTPNGEYRERTSRPERPEPPANPAWRTLTATR